MGYARSVDSEVPVAQVWEAWTNREALQRWLSPKANVEFREGGAWEFFWSGDPAKDSTLGCKILAIAPQRVLRFEWQGKTDFLEMFLPPKGRRTTIEARFNASGKGTAVSGAQEETRSHPKWKAYDAWMSKAWETALDSLKRHCERAKRLKGRMDADP